MLGFLVGTGVALALATLMAQSRLLERAIFPLAILVKVTPIVAIAPLLTIWFGFGLMPKVFIAALIVFFPIMVNALIGFRSVNPNALALLESLAASRSEVFLRLRLPSSLPYLFAAFRVSIPLSVIGAVVAEWFSGDRGLGSVIYIANNNLDMATAFAGVFTLAIIGVGLFLLTTAVERRVLFWHESTLGRAMTTDPRKPDRRSRGAARAPCHPRPRRATGAAQDALRGQVELARSDRAPDRLGPHEHQHGRRPARRAAACLLRSL